MKAIKNFIYGLASEQSPLSSKRAIALYFTVFISAVIGWAIWYSLTYNVPLDHYIITLVIISVLLTVWVMTGVATVKDILLGLQNLKLGGGNSSAVLVEKSEQIDKQETAGPDKQETTVGFNSMSREKL